MSDLHPAAVTEGQLLAECDIRRQRRGGPGGQHRNKVETAVVVLHRPTGLRAEARERRSQSENLRMAVQRLRLLLALEIRTPAAQHQACSPTVRWQQRCPSGRLDVSETHDDYPAILAEAIDAVHAAGFDLQVAAQRLSVTTSQLRKLLRGEQTAWRVINDERRQRGLRPLR